MPDSVVGSKGNQSEQQSVGLFGSPSEQHSGPSNSISGNNLSGGKQGALFDNAVIPKSSPETCFVGTGTATSHIVRARVHRPSRSFSGASGSSRQQARNGNQTRPFSDQHWSDLTIRCPTKSFKVNRHIISSASSVFREAIDEAHQNGHPDTIDLPEDEVVVEFLLRHIYRYKAPDLAAPRSTSFLTFILDARRIIPAAKKYGLPEIIHRLLDAATTRIPHLSDSELTGGASFVFDYVHVSQTCQFFVDRLRDALVRRTAVRLPQIYACEEAWMCLHWSQEYLGRVLERAIAS